MILKDFFRAARITNVLFVMVAQFILSIKFLSINFYTASLILLTGLTVVIGNIENNCLDYELDIQCKKHSSNSLTEYVRNNMQFLHYTKSFILICSLILGGKFGFIVPLFFVLSILFLSLYNHFLKKYLFLGNITIASLCAMSIFMMGYIDISTKSHTFIWKLSLVIFSLILLREVIKDAQDKSCDEQFGYYTLPIAISTTMLQLVLFLILILAQLSLINYNCISPIRIDLLSILGILWTAYCIYKEDWKTASLAVKITIGFGVAILVFI